MTPPAFWDITPDMVLAPSEVERLLAHVRKLAGTGSAAATLDRVLIELLLFSGVRTSECCRLRVADTSVTHGTPALQVRAATGGEGRTVWLPMSVDHLLQAYVRDTRPLLLADGADPTDSAGPLIVNERGRAYERSALYRRVVRVLSAVDLGNRASVQLLRHTYGYLAYLRTGGNLLFVQRQLGHAHPMITSIYARLVPESYPLLADMVASQRVARGGAASKRTTHRKELPCKRPAKSTKRSAR